MSRRRAWLRAIDHTSHDRPSIVLMGRKVSGRPGVRWRVSARMWRTGGPFDMTPQELSKSGSEHGHQRALFAELRRVAPHVYDVTFAIPNGGKRDKSVAGALKAEGVKAGVPDLMVAWPMGSIAGLFVEMKRPADREKDRAAGTLGKSQSPWHDRLKARGYAVAVAYSWDEALAAIKRYFGYA